MILRLPSLLMVLLCCGLLWSVVHNAAQFKTPMYAWMVGISLIGIAVGAICFILSIREDEK